MYMSIIKSHTYKFIPMLADMYALLFILFFLHTQNLLEPSQLWDVSNSHSPFSRHVVVLALVIISPEQHLSVSANSCRAVSLVTFTELLS